MEAFARFIVNHKKRIVLFYMILVIISFLSMRYVKVEYDLAAYLPKNMDSIKGKKILKDEFKINGNASLMIRSNDFREIIKIKGQIQSLPEVSKVIWLDDVEDIKKPQEFLDENLSGQFVKGDFSLLQIQFRYDDGSLKTKNSLNRIDNMIDKEHYIGGQAAVSADMQDTVSREIIYYSLVAFIIISAILLISTSYYYEPVLFFISIGVAIVINMGTNIMFGKISSTTYSVAGILQLAVSMDYSIFLLHRYYEEQKDKDSNDAMVRAITATFGSVAASAFTTIFGFLALLAMKYGIGRDMGLVLAKGVLLSLISVVTLLPCLILLMQNRFQKYKHKVFNLQFGSIAARLVALRKIILILVVLIVIPAFIAQSKVDYYYSNEKTLSYSSKSVIANKKIAETFGQKNELVLIVPKSDGVIIKDLLENMHSLDKVDSIQGLYSMVDHTIPDEFIPKEVKDIFESQRYTYFILNIKADTEGENITQTINRIKKIASNYYNEFYLTGESAVYLDLKEVTSKDFNSVTIISILLISLTLLITFRSITIPIILVFVIELGIWINMSIPYLGGKSLNFIAFIVIGAIQLGATVDYAILFTARYRENLSELSPKEAMIKTIQNTAPSVLTSALILMAGTFSVSFITTIRSASELTLLIGRGAIISLILVFILLPALLLILNKFIQRTTIGWPKTQISKEER